jgi:hypothetical protein
MLRLGGRKANPSISEGGSFCGGIRLGSSLPIDALFRLGLFAAHLKQPLLQERMEAAYCLSARPTRLLLLRRRQLRPKTRQGNLLSFHPQPPRPTRPPKQSLQP